MYLVFRDVFCGNVQQVGVSTVLSCYLGSVCKHSVDRFYAVLGVSLLRLLGKLLEFVVHSVMVLFVCKLYCHFGVIHFCLNTEYDNCRNCDNNGCAK